MFSLVSMLLCRFLFFVLLSQFVLLNCVLLLLLIALLRMGLVFLRDLFFVFLLFLVVLLLYRSLSSLWVCRLVESLLVVGLCLAYIW